MTDPTTRTETLHPEILYEDDAFISVNKRPGVPVQPDPSGAESLLEATAAYLAKRDGLSAPPVLGMPHRIDRPTSGAVLFVKDPSFLPAVNELFRTNSVKKLYWAAVDADPPAESGELVHYLSFDSRRNKTWANPQPRPKADRAVLRYRVAGRSERYRLLEIELVTGRHHQIRAQLAAIGCHVKGDLKYGARRSNPGGGIHLHARFLSFQHPRGGEPVEIIAPAPKDPVWDALAEGLSAE